MERRNSRKLLVDDPVKDIPALLQVLFGGHQLCILDRPIQLHQLLLRALVVPQSDTITKVVRNVGGIKEYVVGRRDPTVESPRPKESNVDCKADYSAGS